MICMILHCTQAPSSTTQRFQFTYLSLLIIYDSFLICPYLIWIKSKHNTWCSSIQISLLCLLIEFYFDFCWILLSLFFFISSDSMGMNSYVRLPFSLSIFMLISMPYILEIVWSQILIIYNAWTLSNVFSYAFFRCHLRKKLNFALALCTYRPIYFAAIWIMGK